MTTFLQCFSDKATLRAFRKSASLLRPLPRTLFATIKSSHACLGGYAERRSVSRQSAEVAVSLLPFYKNSARQRTLEFRGFIPRSHTTIIHSIDLLILLRYRVIFPDKRTPKYGVWCFRRQLYLILRDKNMVGNSFLKFPEERENV